MCCSFISRSFVFLPNVLDVCRSIRFGLHGVSLHTSCVAHSSPLIHRCTNEWAWSSSSLAGHSSWKIRLSPCNIFGHIAKCLIINERKHNLGYCLEHSRQRKPFGLIYFVETENKTLLWCAENLELLSKPPPSLCLSCHHPFASLAPLLLSLSRSLLRPLHLSGPRQKLFNTLPRAVQCACTISKVCPNNLFRCCCARENIKTEHRANMVEGRSQARWDQLYQRRTASDHNTVRCLFQNVAV